MTGEAKASALKHERLAVMSECRRCAVLLLLLVACDSKLPAETKPGDSPPRIVPPEEREAPEPLGAKHIYYQGYLADVLGSDSQRAAGLYQQLLGSGADEPLLVAESALRLAGWAESNHQRRLAIDLAVRASVLGAEVPRIKSAADALRRRIATTVRPQDIEVRGPPAGTALSGVGESIANDFAAAEDLLGAYHRRLLKPRLEALVVSIRGKRASMERAVRAYRDVADSGVAEGLVASEFRIASLYYDFSLSLTFELPSELDPEIASSMRNSLRSEVNQLRAKARSAYARSLAAASKAGPTVKQWSAAAAIGLASVDDLLRGGK